MWCGLAPTPPNSPLCSRVAACYKGTMKKLFKWVFRLLLVLVVLLVVLVLFLDRIAKTVVARQLRAETGMEPVIGKVTVGLKSPFIAVQNARLMNPPEFGKTSFIDVPEFRVEYDRAALWSGKLHLTLLRLNLGELHIIQGKDGRSNLQLVQERTKARASQRKSSESRVEFQGIDVVSLSLGRLKYTCLTNETRNQEQWIGVKNETVKNVKSSKDLEPLVLRIALEKSVQWLADQYLGRSTTNLIPNANAADGKEARSATDPATKQ